MGQEIRLRAKPASSEPFPPLADDLASARRNPKRFSRLRANAIHRLVARWPFGSPSMRKVRFGLHGLCEKPDGAASHLRPTATRRQNPAQREMLRNDGTERGNESPATTRNESRENAKARHSPPQQSQKRENATWDTATIARTRNLFGTQGKQRCADGAVGLSARPLPSAVASATMKLGGNGALSAQ